MAFVNPNATRDTTITSGTGPFAISGTPPTGYHSFDSQLNVGDKFLGTIRSALSNEFQYGLFEYSNTNEVTTFSVIGGSNGAAAVAFGGGTKYVLANTVGEIVGNITPEMFGAVGDGSTDDLSAIQAAIDFASDNNGSDVSLGPKTYGVSGPIVIKTGVRLIGNSGRTTIYLLDGSDSAVIETEDFDTLLDSNTEDGPEDFALIGLRIDGNKTNQASVDPNTQNGINIYGSSFLLDDLLIQNCVGGFIRSQWYQFGEPRMEATLRRVKGYNCGRHGLWFEGPHDSHLEDIVLVDASQETDDTYHGVLLSGYGSGRLVNVHCWHTSAATNRMNYAAAILSGSTELVACHLEGGRRCLLIDADYVSVVASYAYANFGSDPMVLIRGSHHQIQMRAVNLNDPAASCFQLGSSGDGLWFSQLDLLAITEAADAVVVDTCQRCTGTIKTILATDSLSDALDGTNAILVQNPDGSFTWPL